MSYFRQSIVSNDTSIILTKLKLKLKQVQKTDKMVTKLTEQAGCVVAEFIELRRFTLAVTEEVKSELKPLLSQAGTKLILNLKHIEFIDSSGIGCIISLVKTAKSNEAEIKLCNLSGDVMDVIELLHLQMIFDIEKDVPTSIKSFQ